MRPLAALTFLLPLLQAGEPAPLWDGHESVAAYAQRAHLEPTKTLDLGNGVTMELVLIPAGQFVMGTPEPRKPSATVEGAGLLIEFGAIAVLALILEQLLRFFPERRTAFSLRWLMLMTMAGGVLFGGILRHGLAVREAARYEVERSFYDQVDAAEKPARAVTLSNAFYMGKYTVTEAQYTTVVGKNLDHAKGSHFPASFVTWRDANEFCTILNDRLQSSLTLPTETQWEYACRAGAKNTFVAEDANAELDAVAWYGKNSGGRTHPVGGKMPNAFGLFDMRGNVLQWCKDVYADDQSQLSEANINSPKTRCAMRGAPFCGSSFSCRASHRMTSSLKNSGPHIGFRVVLSAPSSKTSP